MKLNDLVGLNALAYGRPETFQKQSENSRLRLEDLDGNRTLQKEQNAAEIRMETTRPQSDRTNSCENEKTTCSQIRTRTPETQSTLTNTNENKCQQKNTYH